MLKAIGRHLGRRKKVGRKRKKRLDIADPEAFSKAEKSRKKKLDKH